MALPPDFLTLRGRLFALALAAFQKESLVNADKHSILRDVLRLLKSGPPAERRGSEVAREICIGWVSGHLAWYRHDSREQENRYDETSTQKSQPAFKSKVALEAIKGEKTLRGLAQQFDVHANQIKLWRDQLLAGAKKVFCKESKSTKPEPTIDVKALHTKIGELILENVFLETALTKAELLGAKK